jgi:hypothetical protein
MPLPRQVARIERIRLTSGRGQAKQCNLGLTQRCLPVCPTILDTIRIRTALTLIGTARRLPIEVTYASDIVSAIRVVIIHKCLVTTRGGNTSALIQRATTYQSDNQSGCDQHCSQDSTRHFPFHCLFSHGERALNEAGSSIAASVSSDSRQARRTLTPHPNPSQLLFRYRDSRPTPGITRRPAPLKEDDKQRVGGRVHAVVMRRPRVQLIGAWGERRSRNQITKRLCEQFRYDFCGRTLKPDVSLYLTGVDVDYSRARRPRHIWKHSCGPNET